MTEDRQVKQCIVMRTDLGMRRGKQIAQACHASISFLTNNAHSKAQDTRNAIVRLTLYGGRPVLHAPLTEPQRVWLEGIFTKICVRVDSEEELLEIVEKAQAAKLTVSLIKDAGLTEFHGVPTLTCAAIGPDWSDEIDPITKDLKLL